MMGDRQRRRAVGWVVTALVLAGMAGLVLSAGAARSATTRTVTFRGYKVEVPASWAVVDLARSPSACVRFDVHAIYLGHPGSAQSCPARLVGRTESLLVEPLDNVSKARVDADTVWVPDNSAAARKLPAPASQEVEVGVTSAGVLVTASYGSDPAAVADVLKSATLTTDAHPVAQSVPAPATAATVSASVVAPGTFTGKGFDACTAPSATAMQAWLTSSPYRAVGIYIGGLSRACSQPNLTASWVSTQTAQGWHLAPIYVGLQAPCTNFNQRIDPANAAGQGRAAAEDAVVQAGPLGIDTGSTVYFDMEAYPADTACRDAVLTFLGNWTTRLHELGYKSGVYSSANSGVHDLVSVYDSQHPDYIWFARWDGVATVSDTVIPSTDWPDHHRMKQYLGGHNESYGGVTINIDNDYLDVATEPPPPPPPPVTDGDQDGPAVVNLGSEIHVFARGSDGRLYETFFRPGSGWSNWATLGGLTIAGSPTAVRYGTGINVYARGTDQQLYETFFRPGSGWSRWVAHGGVALAGDPAAVPYGTGGINVFARGTDQRLYEIYYRTTSGWSTWRAHGGAAIAGDAAGVVYGTEIHVFARGTDNVIRERFYRPGSGWLAWTAHPGVTAVGVPAAVTYNADIHVFARASGHLYETYFRPGPGWSSWTLKGGTAVSLA
jgi:hypothetical protein